MNAVASSGSSLSPRHGSDYSELSMMVRQAGLLRRRPVHYAVKSTITLLVFAAAWVVFGLLGNTWWQLFTAAFLAVLYTQLSFLGHDAGHKQIFGRRRFNDVVGLAMGGLFVPLLFLEGLNLRWSSIQAVWRGEVRARKVDAVLLTVHILAYLTAVFLVLSPGKAFVFIAVHQGLWGLYMGCSFAPNHKGMLNLSKDNTLDFLRKQVLTSHNVFGGRWVDFTIGGLNYQIERHLFPSMPRPNLRRAQPLVHAYCRTHDINYSHSGFLRSYGHILNYLHSIGAPLRANNNPAPRS